MRLCETDAYGREADNERYLLLHWCYAGGSGKPSQKVEVNDVVLDALNQPLNAILADEPFSSRSPFSMTDDLPSFLTSEHVFQALDE